MDAARRGLAVRRLQRRGALLRRASAGTDPASNCRGRRTCGAISSVRAYRDDGRLLPRTVRGGLASRRDHHLSGRGGCGCASPRGGGVYSLAGMGGQRLVGACGIRTRWRRTPGCRRVIAGLHGRSSASTSAMLDDPPQFAAGGGVAVRIAWISGRVALPSARSSPRFCPSFPASGGVVQHVVGDLEHSPRPGRSGASPRRWRRVGARQQGPRRVAAANRIAVVALDHPQVGGFVGVRVAHVQQLQHLALGDGVGGVGEDPHHLQPVQFDHQLEAARIQEVADQHAGHVAPDRVRGAPPGAGRIRRPRRRAAGWRYG